MGRDAIVGNSICREGGGMAEAEVERRGRVFVLASMKLLMERWEDWRGILGPMYGILILRMMMRDNVPPPTSPTIANHAHSIINDGQAIPSPSITDNTGGQCIHDLKFKPAG